MTTVSPAYLLAISWSLLLKYSTRRHALHRNGRWCRFANIRDTECCQDCGMILRGDKMHGALAVCRRPGAVVVELNEFPGSVIGYLRRQLRRARLRITATARRTRERLRSPREKTLALRDHIFASRFFTRHPRFFPMPDFSRFIRYDLRQESSASRLSA